MITSRINGRRASWMHYAHLRNGKQPDYAQQFQLNAIRHYFYICRFVFFNAYFACMLTVFDCVRFEARLK